MARLNRTLNNLKTQMRGNRAWIGAIVGAATLGGILYVAMHHQGEESAPKIDTAATTPAAEPVKAPAEPVQPAPVLETKPTVHFAFDSAELDAGTKAALDDWAKRLGSDRQVTLELDGHCDERGSVAYNMRLGQRRAEAARDYLVTQGIENRRLSTMSFGKSRPAVSGHNEDAWAENRRVEMHAVTALSQR